MTRDEFLYIFETVRQQSELLCQPLEVEDYVIQGCGDVSPPKWHLAHTSWFFETFILKPNFDGYKPFAPMYHYLFNSYYQTIGSAFPRPQRGLLSRPTVEEIYTYRHHITKQTHAYVDTLSEDEFEQIKPGLILGFQHEQQHQELLLMDIKYNFSINPMFPVYQQTPLAEKGERLSLSWHEVEGGMAEIGYPGTRFCFDNELPVHQVFLHPYCIANRLITNEEYLEFINDGGYENPIWWLSDGWDWCQNNNIKAPLYWHKLGSVDNCSTTRTTATCRGSYAASMDPADKPRDVELSVKCQQPLDSQWYLFSLHGLHPLQANEPVSHVSFYEADAYARWRGFRLPREEEWEYYVRMTDLNPHVGNFAEQKIFHPQASHLTDSGQFFGDLWEWTDSHYCAYPGFRSLPGSLGEYNGKFMNNQRVLRGGSCVTSAGHNRISYRNFFQPEKRWQFSGIRLASDHR